MGVTQGVLRMSLTLALMAAGGVTWAKGALDAGSADCATAVGTAQAEVAAMFAGDLAGKIGQYWNLGEASEGAMASRVVVRVCLTKAAEPEEFVLFESDGPSSEAVEELFASAKRAILRAHADGGLPLPADQYDSWRVLELVFDASAIRAR